MTTPPIIAEQTELSLLLDKGMFFTVPRHRLFGRWAVPRPGKSERRFTIHQPYLGTLDALSNEFIRLDFSEERFAQNPFEESKHLVHDNARRCARIVALAVLNGRWSIRLLAGPLARYFLWRVTPQKLLQLTLLIHQMSNLGDFSNSIRFLSLQPRTTAPPLIEKTPLPGADAPTTVADFDHRMAAGGLSSTITDGAGSISSGASGGALFSA